MSRSGPAGYAPRPVRPATPRVRSGRLRPASGPAGSQAVAHPERVLDGTLRTSRIERYLRYVNPVRALESTGLYETHAADRTGTAAEGVPR
ncbi:hypothetical protein ACFXGT_09130 [Streptomyces sp. NPDC059352]|uniref:hypothetical protein n=1 Tax=Streptomyces sp. NPDC059352 TaxID=3346810 RepID=UPI0036ADFBE8